MAERAKKNQMKLAKDIHVKVQACRISQLYPGYSERNALSSKFRLPGRILPRQGCQPSTIYVAVHLVEINPPNEFIYIYNALMRGEFSSMR